MSQNLLLNEVLRKMSDPVTLAALQAATAPLVAQFQQKQTENKGLDPISALMEAMGLKAEMQMPEQPEAPVQEESKQSDVQLAAAQVAGKNGQVFVHLKTNNLYIFLNLTNEKSTDQVKFPTMANYFDLEHGTVWSRPLVDFTKKFVLLGN